MSNIAGLGWLNTNATRNYPISQEANLTPLNSSYKLPDDLIVDMRLSIPYASGIKPFYFFLKSISLHPAGLIVEIGYKSPHIGDTFLVATSEAIPTAEHTNPSVYSFAAPEYTQFLDFSGVVGTITIGNLAHAAETAPGYVEFSKEAVLESTVVVMNTVGVSSFRVGDSAEDAKQFTGHVLLRPGTNFTIESEIVSQNSGAITLHAMDGTGLLSNCVCAESVLGPPIRTINQLPPGTDGNIDLIEGSCISIQGQSHSLLLSETCSEPCCGCDQLDILVADLRDLQNGFERLDSYITALAGAVESIRSSAFGSVVTNNACGD